jgi:cAMP phosphodiesterase
VHLSAITKILEQTQPQGLGTAHRLPHRLESGPFAGMEIMSSSPSVNAAYVTRYLVDTYLITHPHLDHISGFIINTSGLPGSRPKRLAGLPSTRAAFKSHIFNNVIWPNLSDENNGAGLVTYMRLVEGGSPALGEGEGKGYLEVSDGLGVKIFGVSHGHCIERHTHRGSQSSSRLGSMDASSINTRGGTGSNAASGPAGVFRSSSMAHVSGGQEQESVCVYDSSAYFIRDSCTGREVLMFGDVEPDSISLSPRNLLIWQEAASKIATGRLAAIFIECSYDDTQTDDRLFGHLTPRFIVEEMRTLAGEVEVARQAPPILETTKKRKRGSGELARRTNRVAARSGVDDGPVSPKSVRPTRGSLSGSASGLSDLDHGIDSPQNGTPTAQLSLRELESPHKAAPPPSTVNPLKGLKVVIIHVKETLRDEPSAADAIMSDLLDYEKDAQLGCEFIISTKGQSFTF